SQPVELPNIVLPAGTYVFRLLDVPSSRHVVQVFDAEETHLYTTILAIPNSRLTPTDKTVMPFKERAPGMPQAMHAWFYPGDSFGQEFVYPKERAAELARMVEEPILAAPIKSAETPEELVQEPVITVTPPRETEIAKAMPLEPQEPITWETPPAGLPEAPAELPKTATPLPMLGFAGLSALGLSLTFKLLKRIS